MKICDFLSGKPIRLHPPYSKPGIPWQAETGPKLTMHKSKILVDTTIYLYKMYYLFLFVMSYNSEHEYSRGN